MDHYHQHRVHPSHLDRKSSNTGLANDTHVWKKIGDRFANFEMTFRLLQLVLLLQILLGVFSNHPIRPPIEVIGKLGRGGGHGILSWTRTRTRPSAEDVDPKTDASVETSSTWSSLFDSWVQQPAKKIYKRTIPWVFNAKDDEDPKSSPTRHVEQYEIFGMWRLSINDGDTVLLMEIRPHDLSYGRKHKIAKYTFKSPTNDDETSGTSFKVSELISSGASFISFEYDGRIYTAKLSRRRIEDEEGRCRSVLKINGKIYKEGSWWWPQRSVGKFAGRKLAYRELSREQATIWDTYRDDDDTASSTAEMEEEEEDEDSD